jgi:hypothetical protein
MVKRRRKLKTAMKKVMKKAMKKTKKAKVQEAMVKRLRKLKTPVKKAMKKAMKKTKKAKAQEVKANAKLGQAHPLPGKLWPMWLKFVQSECGPRIYFIVFLIQAMCVWVTQAAQLMVDDLKLDSARVWFKAFKGHAATFKPMLPSVLKVLKAWKKNGVPGGPNFDNYSWPKTGQLFPPVRKCKAKHTTKDVVAKILKVASAKFIEKFSSKWPELGTGKNIRSHSGRRHNISEMAAQGIQDKVGMGWAQINSQRVYNSYVELSPEQVASTLTKLDRRRPFGAV